MTSIPINNYISSTDFKQNTWRIKLLTDTARLPEKATDGSSGYDIFADENITLAPGDTALISTGLSMAIPKGYELVIRPRSGMSKNFPNYIANSPGTIDSDYRGEVKVMVTNTTNNEYMNIVKGYKICQGIVQKYYTFSIEIVDTLEDTDRGSDGFGSSGYGV